MANSEAGSESHSDRVSALCHALSQLAALYQTTGRAGDALPLLERALALSDSDNSRAGAATAPAHRAALRSALLRAALADALKDLGRSGEALALHERALQEAVALEGARSALAAHAMAKVGDLCLRLGHAERARTLLAEALAVTEQTLSPQHPRTAAVLSSLAAALTVLARYDEALNLYARARLIKETVFGAQHLSVATVLNNMAATFQQQGALLPACSSVASAAHRSLFVISTLHTMLALAVQGSWTKRFPCTSALSPFARRP